MKGIVNYLDKKYNSKHIYCFEKFFLHCDDGKKGDTIILEAKLEKINNYEAECKGQSMILLMVVFMLFSCVYVDIVGMEAMVDLPNTPMPNPEQKPPCYPLARAGRGEGLRSNTNGEISPIAAAIKAQDCAGVIHLLQHAHDLNAQRWPSLNGILHLAVLAGNSAIVQHLLSLNALDVNLRNQQGHTALHLAVLYQPELVPILLNCPRLKRTIRDLTCKTPRDLAQEQENPSLVGLLNLPRQTSLQHSYESLPQAGEDTTGDDESTLPSLPSGVQRQAIGSPHPGVGYQISDAETEEVLRICSYSCNPPACGCSCASVSCSCTCLIS